MQFFGFRDLKASSASEVQPWVWGPAPEQRTAVAAAGKAKRQSVISRVGWLIYSPVRARVSTAYVESSNPAAGVRGMVLDYDVPLVEEHLGKVLAKLDPQLRPQFIEKTLSGNFRLVWVFDRDVPAADNAWVETVWRCLADRIKPFELHPGLDSSSFQAYQRWTAGQEWFEGGGPEHLPRAVLMETLWAAGKKYRQDVKGDIPLEKLAQEIETRFPGAWQGEFAVGVRGRRFWDEEADNPEGCMVKPDGFICFTGPVSFISWETLLGADWCKKAREDRLDDAIANIHFDGRLYWHMTAGGIWRPRSREDTLLELMDRGFDNRVTKGKTVSDCGRLLNLIQQQHRIDAAMSLVNYHPGITTVRGQSVLNITRVSALAPAATPCTQEAFPWLWEFLQGHFARPEDRPLDHFLAWLQRAYRGLLERRRDMGQAIFLCGPRQNGKTLLATRVIAPLLGDIYADPFDYLTGRTTFNSELFESYLWCLNDADSPRDGEKGSVLSKIKDTVVNPSHHYHKKFGDRAQVDWVGRLLVTLNDDPASVGLLPEVNSNTADKLCFFASQSYAKTWPANRVIEATLHRELPAFARWMLDWTPPAEVVEQSRVGVKSYFDSHVLETSRRQGHAYNFRELLQNWVRVSWDVDEQTRVLTPTELMASISSCEPLAGLARDWKVPVVAKSLTALARDPHSGVSYNEDRADRSFTFHRNYLA